MSTSGSQQYTLHFRGIPLGNIILQDSDFPSLWGKYIPVSKIEDPSIRDQIGAYVKYSIEADRLAQTDVSSWERYVKEHESQFIDLIESKDWYLADKKGVLHRILIPNFCMDGGVIWRWDPIDDPK